MIKDDLIKDIIEIPIKFYSDGSKDSVYSLLKKSGIFEAYQYINEEDLAKVLYQYPDYIDHWFSLSENQRTTSGWYLKDNKNGKYIVGHFSANGILEKTEYSDKVIACSYYIKKEIEGIRTDVG